MTILKKLFLLCACLLLTLGIIAQEVAWMAKNKISKKDDFSGMTILGLYNGEIAVRTDKHFGVLDPNTMELKRQYKEKMGVHPSHYIGGKWVSFRDDARLFKMNRPVCVFYKDHEDESAKETELICIDVYANKKNRKAAKAEMKKNGVLKLSYLINSSNNEWFVYPFTNYIDKTIDHYIYNNKLDLVYEKKIPYMQEVGGERVNLVNKNIIINNEGNLIYTGFESNAKNDMVSAVVFTYDHKKDKVTSFISKSTENKIYSAAKNKNPMFSQLDLKNSSTTISTSTDEILYAGVYKDDEGKEKGTFIGRFDLSDFTFSGWQEVAFTEDILTKIKTNKKGKIKSKIKGEIVIKNLLIKDNNEATLLLEVENTEAHMTMFSPFQDKEESISVDLDCRDILYFNFNAQNKLTYSGVIKKHQKKGMTDQASFVATTLENTTHILFNSLDGGASQLMQFSINEDGSKVTEKEVPSPARKYILPKKLGLAGMNFARRMMATGFSSMLLKDKGEILVEGLDGKRSTLVKIKL